MSTESEASRPDEESGWEDWDEDQRRALGRSHQRTMVSLEETDMGISVSSMSSAIEGQQRPNLRDPKDQILPSGQELDKQERMAKERKRVKMPAVVGTTKKDRRFITKRCLLVSSLAVMCIAGLIAASFLVPTQGKRHASIAGPGRPDDNYYEDTNDHDNNIDSLLRSVTTFFQNAASTVGNEIMPSDTSNKSNKYAFLYPDYAFGDMHASSENGWTPPEYDGLYSTVESPLLDVQPVLWEIKRSGASTLLDILTYCGRLVLSSPKAEGHEQAKTLEIFSTPDNTGHYVNVNTETEEGLLRAQLLGVVESELVHVIATPHLSKASALFTDKVHTGRILAIFRDPIELALSEFRRRTSLSPQNPESLPSDLTLTQYVESDYWEPNRLTRELANVTKDILTLNENHVYAAKRIVQERIVVGLQCAFDESVQRFVNYFGWRIHDPVCVSNFEAARDETNDHERLVETSQEYKTLADRNWADMELYQFITTFVFPNQGGLRATDV